MGQLVFQATLGGAVNLIGPNIASTVNFTLPSADGTSGQALVTNGSGTLSFSSFVSAAAGSNTQVQFNSSGAFAGSANLTFNGTTLTAAGLSGPHDGTVGATTPNTGAFTTLSASSSVTLSGGTANGVTYLNGSKVLTSGSALTFDGTNLGLGTSPSSFAGYPSITMNGTSGAIISVKNNGTEIFRQSSDTSGTYQYTQSSSQPLVWGQASSELMRLTSTGLGIGTSSPAAKLQVVGESRFTNSSNAGVALYYSSPSTSGEIAAYNWGGSAWLPLRLNASDIRFLTSDTERMRIDSSGNLGLGVTPSAWGSPFLGAFEGKAGTALVGRSDAAQTFLFNNSYFNGSNYIRKAAGYANYIVLDGYGGGIGFAIAGTSTAGSTASFTQALTLDASGNLLVGVTSSIADGSNTLSGVQLRQNYVWIANEDSTYFQRLNSNGNVQQFVRAGGVVGSISVTTTATAYNTSSDYRLKDNQQPLTGSGAFIDALQPKTWDWKSDGSKGVGFIAHEVQAVSPQSVVGEKDAVDEDGKPIMQAMEYGSAEFIANIIAELQSLRARVAQLESN